MFVYRTTKETFDIQRIKYFCVIFTKYIATNIQIVAQCSGGRFSYIANIENYTHHILY